MNRSKSIRSRFHAVLIALSILGIAAAASGCKSSGSYEYKPGKGWVPN